MGAFSRCTCLLQAGSDEEKKPLAADEAELRRQKANVFVLRCTALASIGSLLLGYDIGVISGVLPFLADDMNLSTTQEEVFAGLLNFAGAFGALVAASLADSYGRRLPMVVAGIGFVAGSLLLGLAGGYTVLLIGRVVHGFAVGAMLLLAPVYVAELAPAQYRGRLVSAAEISINIGILCSFSSNALFATLVPEQGWRYMFIVGALPSVVFLGYLMVMPESPSWLLANGKKDTAKEVLFNTSPTDEEAESRVAEIEDSLATQNVKETGGVKGWCYVFRKEYRRQMVVGFSIALLQQLNGIESIIYYAPEIMMQVGVGTKQSVLMITVGLGVLKLVMSLLGAYLSDHWGRKPLLVCGFMGMAASLAWLAICMSISNTKFSFMNYHQMQMVALPANTLPPNMQLVVVFCLFMYIAIFAMSAGPVCWLLLSEIFPMKIRAPAMALSTCLNRLASSFVASTFLSADEELGLSAVFGLYTVVSCIGGIFIYLVVPETKGCTLEEVEALFQPKTKGQAKEEAAAPQTEL